MTDYKVEIIKKGKETLEKLLLLLTEDSILFENREEKKRKKHFTKKIYL